MTRPALRLKCLLTLVGLTAAGCGGGGEGESLAGDIGEHPILFVTQMPITDSFGSIGATFANHLGGIEKNGRGGDLWIRYSDGELRNLTEAAGFGTTGFQGADSIGVREPQPHWDGDRAIFSMVVGAPAEQFDVGEYYWQLYEVAGLGKNETPVITKVPSQPERYNNVSPTYAVDDQIIFSSDQPRSKERHLYPQRDEYEMAPTITGLWKLDPTSGEVTLLNHTPSGAFSPRIDSFGRLIFIRWDHLQRDLFADTDGGPTDKNGTFTYADESESAAKTTEPSEVFPEPRPARTDLLSGTNLRGHSFNLFFPWMMNPDGTEEETLNHVGRHELRKFIEPTILDDESVTEFIADDTDRVNGNSILNFFHIAEDPTVPGRYLGTDSVEFGSNSAGQLVALNLPPGANPDQFEIEYVTARDTRSLDGGSNDSGKYRNPTPLSSGVLLAAHSNSTTEDDNRGSRAEPRPSYAFRIRTLRASDSGHVADAFLTPGISKEISYFDPDVEVSYSGKLWELDPVELRPRARPEVPASIVPSQEAAVFSELSIDPVAFSQYLRERELALIVSRNVTSRDRLDRQQPFNLRVEGSTTESKGDDGNVYSVAAMQLFQADQVRGFRGPDDPADGRRVLARPLNDPAALAENDFVTAAPASVAVAPDGSVAAIVPARRALSWQLIAADGEPVVRERYWVTFQPGEIRVCASCHGVSSVDQAGRSSIESTPDALRTLLNAWSARQP